MSNENINSSDMRIESSAFINSGNIPARFTCDGVGINPDLIFKNVPKEAKSLALIVDDPDIPESVKKSYNIEVWDHWVVFNMPSETKKIDENSAPNGIVGKSTRGENKYAPPCPPDREHRYFFKLYAIDTTLALDKNSSKKDVLSAINGHILAQAELMGTYQRK